MKLISHRGNISGPNPQKENHPNYILNALNKGYEVEIDVWYKDSCYWLGHDKPQYKTSVEFLKNDKFWCHAKNLKALDKMKNNPELNSRLNYFWHENDTVTLTSKGYIWAYPGKQPINNSIAVMPEINNDNITQCKGICSDYKEKNK